MNKSILIAYCLVFSSILANAQVRQQISLNDSWLVRSLEESESLPSTLPESFENPGSDWYAGDMPKQVQEFIIT